MTILNLFLFSIGVCFYTLSQLSQHGKLRWGYNNPDSFWHPGSWKRKYKMPLEPASNNFYYRFFKIVHKEKFPGSCTIFVSATDSYHLCQLLFKSCLIATVVTYQPMVNIWIDFIIYFCLWQLVFTVSYKTLSR